jgi:hypothetical protein
MSAKSKWYNFKKGVPQYFEPFFIKMIEIKNQNFILSFIVHHL